MTRRLYQRRNNADHNEGRLYDRDGGQSRVARRRTHSVADRSAKTDPVNSRTWAIWAVLLAAVLVGTTGTAQALGPSSATPLGVGAVRAVLGAFALAFFAGGLSWRTLDANRRLIGLGAVGVAVYQPAFFVGVNRVGVALGTVLAIGSGPAFAGVLAVARGRSVTLRWIVGTTIAVLAGAAMVWLSAGQPNVTVDALGVGAALAAGLGYALYATTAAAVTENGVDATEALAWQFLLGSLGLVPLLIVEPMGWLVTPSGVAMAFHLGVVTIGVAYWLVGYAVSRIDAPLVTTAFQAEPVTAAMLSVTVLSERLPPLAWGAAVGVLIGIWIASSVGHGSDAVPPGADELR